MLCSKFVEMACGDSLNCEIKCSYDSLTKTLKFPLRNIDWIQFACTNPRFGQIIGYDPKTEADLTKDKAEIPAGRHIYPVVRIMPQKTILENYSALYVYCDAVAYQIVGDTQTPLLGVVPVQGEPNDQVYWNFNPPYYMTVNQQSLNSVEIRICTNGGDPFPFASEGQVVCRLHFRRKHHLF